MGTIEVGETIRRRDLLAVAGCAIGGGLAATSALPCVYFNRRIPDEAHTRIGEYGQYGITSFSFTPSNGWVIATEQGPYFARGIPDECFAKLGEFVNAGARIHCIAFPPAGGNSWVITTSHGIFARGIPEECYQQMLTYLGQGWVIKHVAFPPHGGNSWVIVTDGPFFARGIDDECYQMMRNLSQHRRLTRVQFAHQNSGWVVVAENEFYARRIDEECYQRMLSFSSAGWLVQNVAFSPQNNGWSLYSYKRAGSYAADPARQFEANFRTSMGGPDNIWSRMANGKVPGCSIAVVVNNRKAWSCGYGYLESGDGAGATHPESRFQAASLSKPVAAAGVLRLIEESASWSTSVSINSDIRPLLNWTLPQRSCLTVTAAPTVDRILQHRGGIIGRGTTSPSNACSGFDGGGGGFGGYPVGQTLPSLLDILNGTNTNSPRIELTTNPGSTGAYSGAGFVLLQRMIEQVSGQSFAAYLNSRIFAPLGMAHSRYTVSPSQSWINDKQIAAGHTSTGAVIAGKRNRYPELAAAGLYTSVDDLMKLVIFLNRSWSTAGVSGPLTRSSVQTLLSGRGFGISGNSTSTSFSYSHGGSNYGFRCVVVGYPNRGAGYAIMTNGESDAFLSEADAAIRGVYGW